MRYVSLFSGIEAASVAWEPLGWKPLAFAEVDPFACSVLKERYPDVPNLGDVCKIDWEEFTREHGAVDVLVGGSPCQSYSIAGTRTGRAGESGLMAEYIRAVRDLVRASGGQGPRYILWENVPGALSVERGAAFGQLLAELDGIGYGLAWRVLDAQYVRVPDGSPSGFFGPVAQRRRRVFLVGVLGCAGAAEVLFERESLRGDHPKGREAREALAGDPAERVAARCGVGGGQPLAFKYAAGAAARSMPTYDDGSCNTLTADYHAPAVLTVSTANTGSTGSNVNDTGVSYTLDGSNCNALRFVQNQRMEVRMQGGDGSVSSCLPSQRFGTYRNEPLVMGDMNGRASVDEGVCGTLHVAGGAPVMCLGDDNAKASLDENLCGSLKVGGVAVDSFCTSNGGMWSAPCAPQDQTMFVHDGDEPAWQPPRRLTPDECERLQGFPTGWTDVEHNGRPASDTARYKATGNSMAVPVMTWLGRRIEAFDVLHYDEVGIR